MNLKLSKCRGFRMSTTHTILLVQPTKKPEGRTYSDYESVNDCMEGVCRIYEEHLKKSNPSSSQITYDISQVAHHTTANGTASNSD